MIALLVRLVHLWDERDTPEGKQLIRYIMVSVISTAVSLAVLGLIYGVLHLWAEVGSTVFANAVATVPSYYLNRNWVWGKSGRSHVTKEVVPFWSMSAVGIVVSIGGAGLARHLGIEHHLHHVERTALVLIANLASFAVFWVLKFLLFDRLFRVHPLEELDELVESL